MQATDAGAGGLLGDTRKPPSAASEWRGALDGKGAEIRMDYPMNS